MRPRLALLLEHVRALRGHPVKIVSGYRCPVHNKAINGAADSQHMYGAAADLPPGVIKPQEAAALLIPGYGIKGEWVVHVDVRDVPVAPWHY